MAATARFYSLFFKSLCNKEIDLGADVFKLMLCTSDYAPDQNNHRYKSSVTHEIAGPGYAAGGATIGALAVTYNSNGTGMAVDGADAVWSSSSISARYAVLYDSTPASDTLRPLVGYVDFGATQSTYEGTFSVEWSSSGIGAFTVT